MSRKLVYEPDSPDMCPGFYLCPECKAEIYSSKAHHEKGCSNGPQGLAGCEYHFGDAHVRDLIELSRSDSRGENSALYGLSIAKLREGGYGELVDRLSQN